MLDVQHSISGALLPVMPLPDTSATPNSNSCHRDSTAQRRQRADWWGSWEEGEARWRDGYGAAGTLLKGQQQLTRRQGSFYPPPALQPDVLQAVFWVQCWKASCTDIFMGRLQQLTLSWHYQDIIWINIKLFGCLETSYSAKSLFILLFYYFILTVP